MRPNGSFDNSCKIHEGCTLYNLFALKLLVDIIGLQSREVWTGTTYALAALMLHEGIEAEDGATSACDTAKDSRKLSDLPTRFPQYIRSCQSSTLMCMGFATAQGTNNLNCLVV